MDNIKDIARKDAISRFFNKTVRTQPFGNNVSGDRAYRRAERIVAAIHLVTNHVPDTEAARQAARKLGIDLLSAVLALRDEMRVAEASSLRKTQTNIRKLISIIQVLSIAGYISLQNAEALVGALDELGVFLLAAQRTPLSESTVLTRELLLDVEEQKDTPPRLSDTTKGQRRNTTLDKSKTKARTSERSERTRTRTDRIVGILRGQGTLGIKDITAHLSEYSEKMIQRELKNLVALGRVKKMGAKRWSMYSLVQ